MYQQPSISSYALIGDCRTVALISKEGSIDWLCLPDFHSPSIFGAIIDSESGGRFSITLKGLQEVRRRYRGNTAVLETEMWAEDGAIILTDCMPIGGDYRASNELRPLREVLRQVRVLHGVPEIQVYFDPRSQYGRSSLSYSRGGPFCYWGHDGSIALCLCANVEMAFEESVLKAHFKAQPKEIFWFSLTAEENGPGLAQPLREAAAARIEETVAWWKQWTAQCDYVGPHSDAVIRSAVTLRLLTCTITGALVAAATTSLPEAPGGGMNWDYRYCWPRDSALALDALMRLGFRNECAAFFDWLVLAGNTTKPRLKAIYDIYGRGQIGEKKLCRLSGYRGARPVRIGNAVDRQTQLDVYGEVMFAACKWLQAGNPTGAEEQNLLRSIADTTRDIWRRPDNGIWELRDRRRHYTYSKAMAWSALNSTIQLALNGTIRAPIEPYLQAQTEIRTEIEARSKSDYGAGYSGVLDDPESLDVALLLLPKHGYVPYNHPRMEATWQAIRSQLEEGGLLRRYPPAFGGNDPNEGSLIVCNLWAVEFLARSGRVKEAHDRMDRIMTLANDVGLYSEAVDIKTGEALGNTPQAYSHAGLIQSIMALEQVARTDRQAA